MASEQLAQVSDNDPTQADSQAVPLTSQRESVASESSIDDSLAASTETAPSELYRPWEDNGRTYHYETGRYHFPNDEDEMDRLDLQHHLCWLTLRGKLHLGRLSSGSLRRVLEIGAGTGIWAIDFAKEHPATHVLGLDLSDMFPPDRKLPPNLLHQFGDVEDKEIWDFRRKFDFIYARMMNGSIANWPLLFSRAHDNLKPGAYIELLDMDWVCHSADNPLPSNSSIRRWSSLLRQAFREIGCPADSPHLYKDQLQAAGFVDITESRYIWPHNSWPEDRDFKKIGRFTLSNLFEGLKGISVSLFINVLGWNMTEVEILLAYVRKEMIDKNNHHFYEVFVIYARKAVTVPGA